MKDIAIYGAGGFGREVACLINLINEVTPQWNIVGFFDDNKDVGEDIVYGKLLGGMDALNSYASLLAIVIAVGVPNSMSFIHQRITNSNIYYPNIIAPNTIFLDKNRVTMGEGNIICSNCLISCDVAIGSFNLFNGYIPVGHDTIIGNYNVIMPSSNISGGVKMGNGNFFGVKSTVLQYITIGNDVRVGANSVIMRHTKDGFLYMGNPAIRMKL